MACSADITAGPPLGTSKFWSVSTHAIDRFIGRHHCMREKLVVDDRRLIAVAPYRMPRSSGCVLDRLEAFKSVLPRRVFVPDPGRRWA